MAKTIIKGDNLVDTIRKFGKFDLKGCFNCATCSIICPLTSSNLTFPRKLMLIVRYGLKDELVKSLEPWLCYYCGECSKYCPRDAKPGESMMTLRRYLSSVYDFTSISKLLYTSLTFRILINIFVAFLTFLLIISYHFYVIKFLPSEFFKTPMGLEHMFNLIVPFTISVFIIPLTFLFINLLRMIYFIKKDLPPIPFTLYLRELKTLILNFFGQIEMLRCEKKSRWVEHFTIFSGFLIMSVIVVFFLPWFQTDRIYPITHPQRWIGYIATLLLFYGTVKIIISRIRRKEPVYEISEPSDWILLIMLFLTTLTGILVHIFRYLKMDLLSHYFYFAHIVIVVPMLLIEIPFGKLSHILYRPFATYFQKIKDNLLIEKEGKL